MKLGSILKQLEDLGFHEGSIVETILVTVNEDRTFNAAPMGVRRKGELLVVSPFNTSKTFRNLLSRGRASVNITWDPMVWFQSAFKEETGYNPPVEDLVLLGSAATILLEKEGERLGEERSSFKLRPLSISIWDPTPQVLSRGRVAAIEAVIHATRIRAFKGEGVESLVQAIREEKALTQRVSPPGSPELRVFEGLGRVLGVWGVKL